MKNLLVKASLVILSLFISQVSVEKNINAITSYIGNYKITITGKVGGPYEPTGSIVSGTTTGIMPFSLKGNITLSESEPGVIAVPEGSSITGINPGDVIFGAAVVQNPVKVFIGSGEADRPGDFGIYSSVKYGLPSDANQLFYSGCNGGSAFNCIPMFFRRHTYFGDNINLVYFLNNVNGNPDSIVINGTLYDRHLTEAAAANLFNAPVESPILGKYNEFFVFTKLTQYTLVVKGNKIKGRIKGTGFSVTGSIPQEAIFEVELEGTKEGTTNINKTRSVNKF